MSDETATIDAPETPDAVATENPTPPAPEGAEKSPAPEADKPWKQQLVPLKALHEERDQKKAYREERDFYKAQLEAFKAGQQPASQPQQDSTPDLDPRKYADDPLGFAKALKEAAKRELREELAQESAQNQQKTTVTKASTEYTEKIVSAVERHPDIVERAQYLDQVLAPQVDPRTGHLVGGIDPDIGFEILSSPHAADLVVELTNNPDALRSIMDPNPIRAAKALAKLEDRVSSQTAPQPKPPIPVTKTVSGASAATKTPAEMSDAEWYAARGFKG